MASHEKGFFCNAHAQTARHSHFYRVGHNVLYNLGVQTKKKMRGIRTGTRTVVKQD
jgi:hypothetical protein